MTTSIELRGSKSKTEKKRLAEIYAAIHESHASAFGDGDCCSDPSTEDLCISWQHDAAKRLYEQAAKCYGDEDNRMGDKYNEHVGDSSFDAGYAIGHKLPRPFAGGHKDSPEHTAYEQLTSHPTLEDFYGIKP